MPKSTNELLKEWLDAQKETKNEPRAKPVELDIQQLMKVKFDDTANKKENQEDTKISVKTREWQKAINWTTEDEINFKDNIKTLRNKDYLAPHLV